MEPQEQEKRGAQKKPSVWSEDGREFFVQFPDGILHVTPNHPDFAIWSARFAGPDKCVQPGNLLRPGEETSEPG